MRLAAASLFALALSCAHAAPAPARQKPAPVLVVTIDGLMPETYLEPDRLGLKIPTLRALAQRGAVSPGALSVFPSVTYPAHTTLATGVQPGVHGITSNRPLDPLGRNSDGWLWYAEDIEVPTLWELAEQRGLKTALVNWPVTAGARATVVVPEYWRNGAADDRKLLRALSTPGLLEAVAARFPDFDERLDPSDIDDRSVTDIAVHVALTVQPDLMFVHLPSVDHAQHNHGPGSPQALTAIEAADAQLARVVAAYQQTGLWERTRVVLASDHGFAKVTRAVRSGVLLREAGLITFDASGRVLDWAATGIHNGGQAYLYLRDPANETARAKLEQVLQQHLGKPESGIARVYSAEELRARGGDPKASFAIAAAEGFKLTGGASGPLVFPVEPAGGASG